MAEKRKAAAKSRAAKTSRADESKTKTKPVAKRAAAKATASKKTVTKSASKASTRSGAKKAAGAKKATVATRAKKPAAKKPAAVKKPVAKAATKKTVATKAKAKSVASKARAKTTAKTGPKTSGAKASTVGKTSVRVGRKSAAKTTSPKQTAAARKAVLSAAAKKFQASGALKKNPNVSGSTRASALKAAGAKQKHAAVRALTVNASSGSDGKKVADLTSDGADSSKANGQKTSAAAGNKKAVNQRHGFKINESVVYPAHGVGKIIGIEEQEIAGMALELFVIHFEKEKLTLRVPTGKLESVGMRKLSDEALVAKSMTVLKGRARVKRTMWSRRAQEYVAKINSGDLVQIAEVVRDLYRSESQPEQSYSERQLYEDALDRMAREVAVVDKLDERGAVQRIIEVLSKSARSRRALEESREEASDASKAA